MYKVKNLFIAILLLNCNAIFAQENISESLSKIMKAAQKGQTSYSLEKQILNNHKQHSNLLLTIPDYIIHKNNKIKYKAYNLAHLLGINSKEIDIRQKCINIITDGLNDKDDGLTGILVNYLFDFNKDDFNNIAIEKLKFFARSGFIHYSNLIKLTGFVGIEELKDFYKNELVSEKQKNEKINWSMHLALAKMGDLGEVNYCLKKVKSLGLSEKIVLYLLPDLVYINQNATNKYLLQLILDDSKNCRSLNPDIDGKIICAFRIIELTAHLFSDMPVTLNEFNEIETDDYDALLSKVRSWINNKLTTMQ